MLSSSLAEFAFGGAILAAGIGLCWLLYHAFRRSPVNPLLRSEVASNVIVVADIGLMVFGLVCLSDAALRGLPH